ncbi:uncharacterized protein LOC114327381 isoform X1 [Diabrotica virgifera virgifera]|uniref:Uncharacterized protein LOC114327381 isoform X2 n=1 Tax=Diabrotica virgifera virgifera TaxID=50390 RepID=A0A6P7F7N3_DIAVI|nr:uncharacterized protein LOC114327381 isoform X1 [Diabrotica virgifera virgifera]
MDVERLIEIVRDNPVLYDTNHDNYMRTKLKDEIWEEIGLELNTDGNSVKDQWRKLRDSYREALRRQSSKIGHKSGPVRLWLYQKEMEFLIPHMKNRTTAGTLTATYNPADTIEYPELQLSDEIKSEHIDDTTVPVDEAPNDAEEVECFQRPKAIKRTIVTLSEPIKRYINNSEERVKRKLIQQLSQEEKESHRDDALYQFFMSMYTITKKLPMKYQRQVRMKVLEEVSKAEEESESDSIGSTESGMPSTLSPTTSYSPPPDKICSWGCQDFDAVKEYHEDQKAKKVKLTR